MSEHLVNFRREYETIAVSLSFDLNQVVAGWAMIRSSMLRSVPAAFSRDEWAYIVSFLDTANLQKPFQQSFGTAITDAEAPDIVAIPRGRVGLWLPNNVSLLGPLMLILVSLTGSPLRMKAGSRSQDLAGEFLKFARENAPEGVLRKYLEGSVRHEVFSQEDPRSAEMARESAVRIVFGSDEAADAIHGMPHPADSIAITFGDRRSEAWIEVEQCDDSVLRDLIKVFAIYGQAGCTSPSRVILLGADRTGVLRVRDRIAELWPTVVRVRPAMHIASDSIRACQVSRALGWESILVSENRAVVSVGDFETRTAPGLMEMRVIPGAPEAARDHLPDNIQTIGHVLRNGADGAWIRLLSGSRVARFVPLRTMHHFGTVWDGQDFWAQLFQFIRIAR